MSETEIMPVEERAVIARAELDQAVATAKAFPRNIVQSFEDAKREATLTPDVAAKCYYTLPGFKKKGGGKTGPVMGPSVRLAEIVQRHWGNIKAGGRLVNTDTEANTITVQCFAWDMEKNVRLDDEYTRRYYGPDPTKAIQAAKAISIRNLIHKLVGHLVGEIFEACKDTVAQSGDAQEAFADALAHFAKEDVTEAQVLRFLNLESREHVNNQSMAQLRGLFTALQDKHTTIKQVFSPEVEYAEIDINEATAKEIEPELPSADTAPKPSREETDA